MKKSIKIFTIFSSVLIAVFVVVPFIHNKTTEAASSLSSSLSTLASSFKETSTDVSVDTTFLNSLTSLSSIKIDTTIFSNKLFSSLVDNSVTLQKVDLGRSNPFAPLPVNTSSNTSSVATSPASSITSNGAVLNGSVANISSFDSTYFEYGSTATLGKATPKANLSLIGSFVSNITGLSSGTTYFYRAVGKTSTGILYGEINSFTTK